MKRRRQHGLLLLPVALALAVTGALAWSMVRDGSTSVSAVDMEYDAQVARYLAEAGINLAHWQNQALGCTSTVAFGTVSLPGGTVSTNDVHKVAGGLSIDVSSATPGGGGIRVVRAAVAQYNRSARATAAIQGKANTDDTFIYPGGNQQANNSKLTVTDDTSRAVIRFVLTSLANILVVEADFTLKQTDSSKSTATTQLLYVHRVTTPWTDTTATWLVPWTTAGGDFIDPTAASMAVTKTNTYYTTRIDTLADAWIRQTLPNYGLLLTSSGLTQAKYAASEDAGHAPELDVTYYPRCT